MPAAPRPHDAPAEPAYRSALTTAHARIADLERELAAQRRANDALHARLAVPGRLARVAEGALPADARRALTQRRIRAVRRELRAAFSVRRYAASAVLGVTATAAFVVLTAGASSSWPLAVAALSMGAVARALLGGWPGPGELEARRRQLAGLKSELDVLRAGRRALPPSAVERELHACIRASELARVKDGTVAAENDDAATE